MIEFFGVLMVALLLGWPLGRYLAAIFKGGTTRFERVFQWLERPIYKALGAAASERMKWSRYAAAFLLSNVVLGGMSMLIFMLQAWLPLNPDSAPNMSWDLALHTAISFVTNTNQQHYSGQAQLSYFSQMFAVLGLQIMTPMMGLAILVATLRALFSRPVDSVHAEDQDVAVGNFWVDSVRATVRFMIPLCLVWSLLLTSQGVPATLQDGPTVLPLDQTREQVADARPAHQKIPLGPVSPMVAAKQLGTNGGGWYGPNSSVPLENPTPLSNALEMLAIVLIPIAVVFMLGPLTGRRKLTRLVLGCMLALSLISGTAAILAESSAGSVPADLRMEGKEVRFGTEASAAWAALTTQTSNGSVNMMHDSAMPLTGLVTISNMLVNAVWGGVGCGVQQFLIYLLLSVFLAGLMTGRTPELFGRKIEAREVRWLAVAVVLQPLVILGLTAMALNLPDGTGVSNPGFHGISQVLYEYTSAFANNGSGFEGLSDNSVWWNVSTSLALLLGRYPTLIIPLCICASLGRKRPVPESAGTLPIETPTFGLTILVMIVVLTLLQFLPVLVLGPIADHLQLLAVRS